MSYDMHISLLALLYILITDNIFRPLDSLVLISSLGFYFMYGFLINDFFDMSYDIAAGKKRTIQQLPKMKFIGIILGVVFISALHLLYLGNSLYIAIYIVSYVLATLYSAPPIKFKGRAFSGIIVNGLIEKMLPVLAVFTFFNHFEIDTLVFLIASFSIGIVDIVVHQIYDYESDSQSDVRTFAVNTGIDKTLNLFNNLINPLSGVIMIILLFLIILKVPYAGLIAALVFMIYAGAFLSIYKGKFNRGEKVFPLYMSCLFFLILNAFPPFLAFVLTLKSYPNLVFLIIAVSSQYYIVKSRFKAVKEKVMPHTEIFIDTELQDGT
ncbi:4-hydroxybenzoate polyprenyltransferase-like prenyltransferase [Candidatus Methanoperedens nitroreducens]|uniref:4-hydroxybenzoate polyprenyltransferase-like prenyltransferase n=1 Tax=Candidatus Methanoperedens nitratireducens TaxID=1392998 RepID=A0A062V5V1_9EURY|nr:4-hydroxybenzoate polyprenyltransferase-like prenyltransferase [Candidatus Methanoperedens nitroreducens]